jgi:hypothetical protein
MTTQTEDSSAQMDIELDAGLGGIGGIGVEGSDPARFPMECIPGIAGRIAPEIARVSACRNEPLAAATVLGAVSAAMGASLEVVSGPSRRTRGNLFLMAVAESGTGKSETFKHAVEPMERLETEAMAEWEKNKQPELLCSLKIEEVRCKKLTAQAAGESDAELRKAHELELRQAEAACIMFRKLLAARPYLKVGDVTREKLAELMEGQPGQAMASMSSEARGIISIVGGKYSPSGEADFYCAGYSGDNITVDRVKNDRRITLQRPCMSILWMVQPDVAYKALDTPMMTQSGLLPRFITFDPHAQAEEREKEEEGILEEVNENWLRLIQELVTLRATGETAIVPVSGEATEALRMYENENIQRRRRDGDLSEFAPYVARWHENAWRLALVMHAALHGKDAPNEELTEETAKMAIGLMRWFATQQLDILGLAKQKQLGARMEALRAVLSEKGGRLTMNHLQKNHGFKASEVRFLHRVFPKRFSINTTFSPEGGRPSTKVSLIPYPQNPQ